MSPNPDRFTVLVGRRCDRWLVAQVEDMLKRSFAEFHAQRALPQTQQQLRLHEASLQANQLDIE
jgi:superfamily II RNA helicase